MGKKCSLKTVNSKTGKRLAGTAAVSHMISQAGGFDKWVNDITTRAAEKAAKEVFDELLRESRKPQLRIVNA